MTACTDHPCDRCPTCLAGTCCGERVVDANLPVQGSWAGEHFAPLGELVERDGLLQCHACEWHGHALHAHVRAHRMTPAEYRAWFGLRVSEPLASTSLRQQRSAWTPPRAVPPPPLTTEQRSEITRQREQRLQALQSGRHDPEQQAAWARMQGPKTQEQRAHLREQRRQEDPGHECPECGALVCTWTGRASGTSTKRMLCGERECLRSARRRAAIISNRKRWG